MASEQRYQSSSPSLCVNGCGFFGRPETQNMCSKCHRDYLLQGQSRNQSSYTTKLDSSSSSSSSSPDVVVDPALVENKEPLLAEEKSSRSNDRCGCCNKRVGVAKGFKCRCGNLYCSAHRYPEEHQCSYDFKSAGRKLLTKANPVVQADKMSDRI